ncbi:MAG: YabP/YqfC family sporulation protein [Clostridia bacterium]|nr:YabP/YqfC family sporulation protein [Clostridia bacterium]
MSYKKEISGKLKNSIDGMGDFFNIALGKGYSVVEGHKGIVKFDESCIEVKLKRGSVVFNGKSLNIASSQSKELVIEGQVLQISFEEVYKQ